MMRYTNPMRLFAAVVIGITLFVGIPAHARTSIDRGHTSWESAIQLTPEVSEQVRFGKLDAAGPIRFYRWVGRQGQKLTINLAVPLSSDQRFQPQIVLFQPDTLTAGPILSFSQPPKTIASIYPARSEKTVFERLTQTQFQQRMHQVLEVEQAGTYYLAVYLASSVAGNFRLVVSSGTPSWLEATKDFPSRWWTTQLWAGLSWRSLFMPMVVIGIVAGIWWWVQLRRQPMQKSKKKK